jgi:hypothetical protein
MINIGLSSTIIDCVLELNILIEDENVVNLG